VEAAAGVTGVIVTSPEGLLARRIHREATITVEVAIRDLAA
jgi:hypothetical protein